MADIAEQERLESLASASSAMLLVQLAASQARIGSFARSGLATPQAAAQCYQVMAQRLRGSAKTA